MIRIGRRLANPTFRALHVVHGDGELGAVARRDQETARKKNGGCVPGSRRFGTTCGKRRSLASLSQPIADGTSPSQCVC
jgi:hypothetical protein